MVNFFTSYPQEKEEGFCRSCFEKTYHYNGVAITRYGIASARICLECENIEYADEPNNPFTGINDKLDRLLSWAGLRNY